MSLFCKCALSVVLYVGLLVTLLAPRLIEEFGPLWMSSKFFESRTLCDEIRVVLAVLSLTQLVAGIAIWVCPELRKLHGSANE